MHDSSGGGGLELVESQDPVTDLGPNPAVKRHSTAAGHTTHAM